MNGKLISIEGIDGSGKTTLINSLKEMYPEYIYTTEPNNDTWLGEVVRKSISSDDPTVPQTSILFLFLAEHANHVDSIIKPNLKDGNNIICDRYIDSRYAYQSHELEDSIDGNTLKWIRNIQEQSWTVIPDTTILLDIPVNVAIDRISDGEIFEHKNKLENFRSTYLEIAESEPNRYSVVDATEDPNNILDECKEIIEDTVNK